MNTFSTFEAKNRLSEVIALAEKGEPQIITRNGRKTAVVISYREFEKLSAKQESLSDFLLSSPLRGSKIDLSRSPDTGRVGVDFEADEFK